MTKKKTKSPWTAAQLRELEQELRRERARLARAADGGDALSAVRVQVLDDALQRMEDGAYGICASCEQPIPFGRLAVVPETDHCLSCHSVPARRHRPSPAA